MIEDSILFFL